MRVPLTDVFVRSAKPPERGSVSVFDANTRGLCLRVSAAGTKSFCLVQGKRRKRSYLGKYPFMSLADARTQCRRIISERTLGISKHEPSIRVGKAVENFLDASAQRNKPRTVYDYKRLLERHLMPALGTRSLDAIKTQDISKVIDRLKTTPTEQNHAHSAIAIFLRWCVRRGYIEKSPTERLELPARLKARIRVLSDSELTTVWKAANQGHNFGRLVQLCILLGQRRSEIGALRWEWIDPEKRTIMLPVEIAKNNRAHMIPYGSMAAKIIDAIPRTSSYVFPSRNFVRPFSGWSQCKTRLDKAITETGYQIEAWTLHDLRRTFATNLAALSTPIHVTEKLLNHVSGTTGGIVAVYQRHAYVDEMRAALEKWEAHLTSLLAVE